MKNKLLKIVIASITLISVQVAAFGGACAVGAGGVPVCPVACCSNWYIGGTGSVAWHNDFAFDTGIRSVSFEYKTGWGAGASVGYIFDLCNQWDMRLEGEFLYRRNNFKQLNVGAFGNFDPAKTIAINGHNRDAALMANLIFDAPLSCDLSLYFGGGLGVSFNQLELRDTTSTYKETHKENLFAWQGLAGFAYNVCPNVALTLGYRIFCTEKGDQKFLLGVFEPKHIPMTQSVDFGLRFRL